MDKHAIRSVKLKENVRSTLRRCYLKGEPDSMIDIIGKGPAYKRLYDETEVDASLFVLIIARMAEQLSYDEFNGFWFNLSDHIYLEEAGYGNGDTEESDER